MVEYLNESKDHRNAKAVSAFQICEELDDSEIAKCGSSGRTDLGVKRKAPEVADEDSVQRDGPMAIFMPM